VKEVLIVKCMAMEKKKSWQLILGVIIFIIITVLRQFAELPDFICGFGYGLCIVLELYGLLAMNHNVEKLKNFKRRIIGLKG